VTVSGRSGATTVSLGASLLVCTVGDMARCFVERFRNRPRGARLRELLVDQGAADQFLETQLKPQLLESACAQVGVPLTLRMHEGYDHSYFFISTFIEDHLRWHAQRLGIATAR
jgi:hypothetical protein